MISNASIVTPKGVGIPLKAFPSRAAKWNPAVSSVSFLAVPVKFFNGMSLCVADSGRVLAWAPLKGNPSLQCSATSVFMFQGDCSSIASTVVAPSMPASIFHDKASFLSSATSKRHSFPRASVYSSRNRDAVTMKKPKWWWRSLACLPYLMPLHVPWMYAETGYSSHPFIKFLEPFAFPFCQYFIGFLPTWSMMLYYYAAYLGVVQRKEWPRFFRHHVITAMLLDNILQVVTTSSRWTPIGYGVGKPGMHIWTALVFALIFAVLDCMRRALMGEGPQIPFVGDAACIHMDARLR